MNFLRRLSFLLWYFRDPPWDTNISPPELLDFINRHPPGRVLDLGCGTGTNVITLAHKVEKLTSGIKKPLKVAVMGCSVNGPGEAKHADIGVTGSGKIGIIFRKGRIVRRVSKKNLLKEFLKELKKMV